MNIEPKYEEHLPKVLIVDDTKSVRDFYSRFLRKEGFKVDEAVDGKQGLEKITNGDYIACIVDGEMPRMSGIDMLKNIQFHQIYKIFNSGNPELIKQAEKEDIADVCFNKPFSLSEMLSHVNYAVHVAETELIVANEPEYF